MEGKIYIKRIKGGILGDGVNSALAAVFNTFPNTTFSQNNGVIQLTGVASRYVGMYIAAFLVILGLFPDLKRLYQWPGGQLSGGQQQMLAIARALVSENRLLLIDEPSEGLAPVLIEQIMEVIRQLSDETTVLLVEQNFRVASQLADNYTIIEDGKSVLSGKMDDLMGNDELITRYLGAA